jgi:beta-glucosidase
MGDMYLPIDAEGLADAIDLVAKLNKPIFITETGIADQSDLLRQKLVPLYLQVIKEKRSKGVDIKGVYLWTAWDNYEWNEGNTKSFGFFDENRNPRHSVAILTQCIRENQDNHHQPENAIGFDI